ncbi:hypothetical protein TRVL_09552 [Trypanosoma vivax]|nr:hypothetical protein TRVL_09552 [Trypanosoma vivax]
MARALLPISRSRRASSPSTKGSENTTIKRRRSKMRFYTARSLSMATAKARTNGAPSPGSSKDAPSPSTAHRAPPPSKARGRPALQRLHRLREVSVSDRLEGRRGTRLQRGDSRPQPRGLGVPLPPAHRAKVSRRTRPRLASAAPIGRAPSEELSERNRRGNGARARGRKFGRRPPPPKRKGHGAAPATKPPAAQRR